jgi:pilus assembly protein Flp/PilA
MWSWITNKAHRLIHEESGATLVEYILLLALIAVATLIGVGVFGNKLGDRMNNSATKIGDAIV